MKKIIERFGTAIFIIAGFLIIFFTTSKMSKSNNAVTSMGVGVDVAHADAPASGAASSDSAPGDSISSGDSTGSSDSSGK